VIPQGPRLRVQMRNDLGGRHGFNIGVEGPEGTHRGVVVAHVQHGRQAAGVPVPHTDTTSHRRDRVRMVIILMMMTLLLLLLMIIIALVSHLMPSLQCAPLSPPPPAPLLEADAAAPDRGECPQVVLHPARAQHLRVPARAPAHTCETRAGHFRSRGTNLKKGMGSEPCPTMLSMV
jgi:hypothetical protein